MIYRTLLVSGSKGNIWPTFQIHTSKATWPKFQIHTSKATYDPHSQYTSQMTHIPNTHLKCNKWPTFPIHISNATNDPHSQCISQRQQITNIPNTHPNGIKTTHSRTASVTGELQSQVPVTWLSLHFWWKMTCNPSLKIRRFTINIYAWNQLKYTEDVYG
jgi:hypothetical protein